MSIMRLHEDLNTKNISEYDLILTLQLDTVFVSKNRNLLTAKHYSVTTVYFW